MEQRHEAHPRAAPDIERADALRAIQLWADRLIKSIPIVSTSSGILPAACAASLWNQAPLAWASAAISASGWMTPISLFTAMIETSAVRSVIASASRSSSIRPSGRTGRTVTEAPSPSSARADSMTHLCSVAAVTR